MLEIKISVETLPITLIKTIHISLEVEKEEDRDEPTFEELP